MDGELTLMVAFVMLLLVLFLMMSGLNFFTALRLEDFDLDDEIASESVSVLVPARNEEENLPKLLKSLASSHFRPSEILVLDDESEDRTFSVAQTVLAQGNVPFQVIRGQPWSQSAGMTGKNHACQQLADRAKGDILVFCDADVQVSPQSLGRTIAVLQRYRNVSGVSGLPRQVMLGIREQLVIPWIMQLPIIFTVPLAVSWQTRFASLQIANGQWLAIRKEAYQRIGGHRALGQEVLDDVVLARKLTQMNEGSIVPVIASRDLQVTMYSSWESLLDGFSKNLVPLFGGSVFKFLILLMGINFVFLSPVWLMLIHWHLALLSFVLILFSRLLTGQVFRNPRWTALSHFQSLIYLDLLALTTIRKTLTRKLQWKGRPLNQVADESF